MRTRSIRSTGSALMSISLSALLAIAAQAANIQQVTVSPGSVAPQGQVQITVLKGGAGNCGAKLLFGDGAAVGPFGFANNPQVFTHTYAQGGTYTITAKPRIKGSLAKCSGSEKTTTLTVQTNQGPGAARLGPAAGRGPLVPKLNGPVKATAAPNGGKLGPLAPLAKPKGQKPGSAPAGNAAMPDIPEFETVPGITSIVFEPGSIGSVGGNTLAPGGTLTVTGSWIGQQKGKLDLHVIGASFPEYPGGKINLEAVKWLGHGRASGRIPTGMTGPIYQASVKVVLTTAEGKRTLPFPALFEVPTEIRVLKFGPPDVVVLQCSEEGGMDFCPYDRKQTAGATISGLHSSGDFVNHENGTDRFAVKLRNGWTFHRVKSSYTHADDTDEFVSDPTSSLPLGGTEWYPVINWSVSPYDDIHYGWWIEIKRPKGAY